MIMKGNETKMFYKVSYLIVNDDEVEDGNNVFTVFRYQETDSGRKFNSLDVRKINVFPKHKKI